MHALGNSYIYVSEFEEALDASRLPALAVAVSDVRKGIGSDGLILVGPSAAADVRMRIFNADGSEAETCGNGLRCVAKYAYDRGYVRRRELTIETKGGVVQAYVHAQADGPASRVTVDMGTPAFGRQAVGFAGPADAPDVVDIPHADRPEASARRCPDALELEAGGERVTGLLVSMGNPHFVTFVKDAAEAPVSRLGPAVERHPWFPARINVEFVTPRSRSELDFRVWERGSGITYACGTGACASVAAGVRLGLLDAKVTVHLLGGDLEVEWRADGHVWMTGEAVEVLTGEYHGSPSGS